MSVLLILYNNNGAVICSDSRENSGPINFNNTIKVRYNESIIVGQIGLYSYNNIDYKKIITEELLKGKELNQILNGKYKNINPEVKKYIIENNIYVQHQLKNYLTSKRLLHVTSVKNLALNIYKSNKEGLNKNKIVTACLLHDVAREFTNTRLKNIVKKYYPERIGEQGYILHQYVGEYIAKKKFYIEDNEILEAIKWHTTGSENMNKLSKLVYVSDKLDPLRPYDTTPLINKCKKNLNEGFIEVLKDKIRFSIKKDEIKTLSEATKEAINHYLKGEIDGVRINY